MAKRTGRLASMSVADLQREIARRQRSTRSLQQKRAKLLKKLAALDAQITAAGGSVGSVPGGKGVGARGGTRPKNEMSLVDALGKVLKGKTMGVAEAAEAVQKAGYKTNAASFRTVVNIALINSGKFKRVERGQYTAK